MLTIGLTGGIGSGKSAVTELFQQLGVPVIDADLVAREVVAPGETALELIEERFGPTLLLQDGTLDRRRLREIVFRDEQARRDLESILHPRIRARMLQQLSRLDSPYAILAIPLLLETDQAGTLDRVLVVDCPEETQIRRICIRDRITPAQARDILAAQSDRQSRLATADDIIDNAGDIEQLKPQVLALHRQYLAQSS